MKRLFACALLFVLSWGAASAQTPQPPEVAARQYLLLDLSTGQLLAERDADSQADPASLTKLMTAYLVFNAIRDKKLDVEQQVPVSQRAWAERKGGGSLMFIDTTMTPRVSELLRGMIVQSGNDASVALAEAVGGTLPNFVAAMNRQAQAWGLKNTQFRNVTGLTEGGHYTSARDIAFVARRVIEDHPDFLPLYSQRQYTYNNIRQDNRNLLLGRDPSVDGLKTGFTEAAGWCLVATAVREFPNGPRRLLSVVLGTSSAEARAGESQKLLNWGFTAWNALRLFEAGKPVAEVPVWKGDKPKAALGASTAIEKRGVWVNVPAGDSAELKVAIERTDPLVAPLVAGQRVGTIKVVTPGGSTVATLPLVVMEPVALAGFFGRTWDSIRLWIQ
ncbi:MAG: D-alanyl-D-alanine carboxypeptidase [Rubrivivax sp.]|nr:D-alanyl-D-alanine carboxypeptidase [Rubrivivax sp.]